MDRSRRVGGFDPRWFSRLDSRFNLDRVAQWIRGRDPGPGDCGGAESGAAAASLRARDDGCGPRSSRGADGPDHAAQGVQSRRHFYRVRCRSRDLLRGGPWRTRDPHELQATASSPEIAHAINVATSSGAICLASAGTRRGSARHLEPSATWWASDRRRANPPTRSPSRTMEMRS